MSKIDNSGEFIVKKAGNFLSYKPIWLWWLAYISVSAILMVIFYLAQYILTVKWWIGVILVPVIGLVWGTIAYANKKIEKK